MKSKIDLTSGSILKKLLIVAIPTLATSLVQMLYTFMDMFWVGKTDAIGLDPNEAVAGVGTGGFYPWLGFGLILLAKVGTSVKISQAAGKNDFEAAKKYANSGLVLMIALSIIYVGAGVLFGDQFVGIFKLENTNIIDYSNEYLRIMAMFGFSYFIFNLFNGIYDGLGKTLNTLIIMSFGLLINMVLDPILILNFEMGVKGAAIATVASQGIILLIYLVLYKSKFKPLEINLKKYFSLSHMKEIFKLGLPAGAHSMLFSSISLIIAVIVATYGEKVMATQRIGSHIEALSWMMALGFQVALASFVGQNYGANKLNRIREGYFVTLKLLVPYGIIVTASLFFFGEQIFGLFISDPITVGYGSEYLKIIALSQLFMILELATAGAFNGLGKTHIPSFVGITGNVLRIPFAIIFSASIGFVAIWWVVSITALLKGIVLVIWFLLVLRAIKSNRSSLIVVK